MTIIILIVKSGGRATVSGHREIEYQDLGKGRQRTEQEDCALLAADLRIHLV